MLTNRAVRNANLADAPGVRAVYIATTADNAQALPHGQIEDRAQGDALTGEDLSVRTSG